MRSRQEPAETTYIVTGKFIRVDFEARKLEILYPGTNKILDCFYQEDFTPVLPENPGEMIQVIGSVELNADEEPVRITDVQDILEVDLSPIPVRPAPFGEGHIVARQPIELHPVLSETKQLYRLEDEEIGISLFAYTRDELVDMLDDYIVMLWTDYAQEKDEILSGDARELKVHLLEAFEVRN